jgi:hypothetical protein
MTYILLGALKLIQIFLPDMCENQATSILLSKTFKSYQNAFLEADTYLFRSS